MTPLGAFVLLTVATASLGICQSKLATPQENIQTSPRLMGNLKRLLNFVLKSPEFQPSNVVVASAVPRFDRWIDGYFAGKAIDLYRVKSDKFSKNIAHSKSRLSWIIFANTLNVRSYGETGFWNTKNRYVIIFGGDCDPEVRNAFNLLWQQWGVFGVILASHCDEFKSILKYSLFKKTPQDSYGVVDRVSLDVVTRSLSYTKHNVMTLRSVGSVARTIPSKWSILENFENLNGYLVNVTIFTSTLLTVKKDDNGEVTFFGAESIMINVIREKLNATFLMGTVGRSGDPFSAALNSLKKGTTDMILTNYLEKSYGDIVLSYDFTTSVSEDKLCLVVPAAGPVPKPYLPLLPFTMSLWIVLILNDFAIRALRVFVRHVTSAHRQVPAGLTRTTVVRTPINFLNFFMDLCFSSYHPSVLSERVLVASTLLTGIVFLGSYHSGLVSCLSKPIRQVDLNTLADVMRSELLICSKYENLLDGVFDEDTPVMNGLRSKIRLLSSGSPPTADMVAFHKNISMLTRASAFDMENLTKYFDEEGHPLMHLVAECPSSYTIAYVVRYASPFLKRLNYIIMRIEESGLHRKWMFDEKFANNLNNSKYIVDVKREIVLTLEHFQIAFICLFIGLSVSLLTFLGEMFCRNRTAKK